MRAIYLLAITPSPSVENEVLGLKATLGNRINYYPARHSEPHITIVSVVMDDSLEYKLLKSLHNIIAQERPISMTASGIGYFVPSQTIFVGIKEISLFSKLSRNISKNSIIAGFPSKFKCSTYVPHLTIGRNLNYHFNIARNCFHNYAYEETFTATSALLLKRYEGGRFLPVQEFPFSAMPASQLAMFNMH